jgi:hypothetical protein
MEARRGRAMKEELTAPLERALPRALFSARVPKRALR